MARRLQAMKSPRYANGFEVTCHEDALEEPLRWRKPRMVFVCSMGDLFHEDVPRDFIYRVFATMEAAPQHQFQVLTKRPLPAAMFYALSLPHWPKNVWFGTTIENAKQAVLDRVEHMLQVPAPVQFVSLEPLLGPVDLTRISYGTLSSPAGTKPVFVNVLDNTVENRINWVIVGGESGPGARPMELDWARDIRDQCRAASVPFFFKQTGKRHPGDGKGAKPENIPKDLRIREYPK